MIYFGVFAGKGGIEEFTADLVFALLRAGHNVHMVCSSLGHPLLDELRAAGARVTTVSVYHGCTFKIPDYALLPVALAAARKADVVIHQKPFPDIFYRFLSGRCRHVYITSTDPHVQFPGGAGRWFLQRMNLFLTQSSGFESKLINVGVTCPTHVIPLIPPPVHTHHSGGLTKGESLNIAMMGRLENPKNPSYAVDVVAEINQLLEPRKFGCTFNIYGAGSLEAGARERAGVQGVKAVFHGRYKRDEVDEIVAANDLFLITSGYEGQCIVALEVLAGGRPVFATPVGVLPEVLERPERGGLIDGEDAAEAANTIVDWLDANKSSSPQTITDSYLEEYDRETVIKAYIDQLQELMEG